MPAERLPDEVRQRRKDMIEACLREGFTPLRQSGGRGSAVQEAARRLIEIGFAGDTRRAIYSFVRAEERDKARGLPNFLPDWSLYATPGLAPAQIRRGRVHRWILTAAQDDTDVHPRFWTNLRAYANYLGAQLHVAGFTYQQVRHTDRLTLTETYRRELRDHLRFDALDCGPVVFAAEMNTLPTAGRPLSGLAGYSRGRDAVFPHAKLAYETVAQTPGSFVPSIMTTGAVTVANYIPKKAGLKAQFHHILGATLVEVDGDGAAWCRQIVATQDGTFQDLDAVVKDGRVTLGHRVKAIVHGDTHVPYIADEMVDAVWGRRADSMIDALRPEYQFFHDLFDMRAWSRHVADDPHHRARLHFAGGALIEGEVRAGVDFLRQAERDFCRSVVVGANHLDRLVQYARAQPNRMDTENSIYWHRLNLALLEAARDGDDTFDLVLWAMRQADAHDMAGIEFVPVGGSFVICQDSGGIECGLHGHQGPNGSRGTPAAFAKMATRLIRGDAHSPSIVDGAMTVGVLGHLQQGYNTGPSSWRHASAVVYPNGKRSLITLTEDGRWRA